MHPIAIDGERRLVFLDGLRVPFVYTQQLAFDKMGKRATRRCLQDLPDERFRTRDVGPIRDGHLIENPSRECERQPALCLDGSGIERQRPLE